MNRLKPEIETMGQDFMSNLISAHCEISFGGDLGGGPEYDPAKYPEDQRPYLEAYAAGDMTSVEACYLYMKSLDKPVSRNRRITHWSRVNPCDPGSDFFVSGITEYID
jgi:hypothetical protein